jgi:hypothetical protein
MRRWRAKRCHNRVTQELVNLATVAGNGGVEHLEAAIDRRDELLRWQHFRQARKAADVGEEDADWAKVAFDGAAHDRLPVIRAPGGGEQRRHVVRLSA